MNRGARQWDVFLDDDDRRFFLRLIGEAHEMTGMTVLAYCLMANHYHLIVRMPEGRISSAMKHIAENYTRAFNHFHQYDGPLFRSRFASKLIDSDDYLRTAARYVDRNPAEVGLDPRKYPWSSLRVFAADRPKPPWFDAEPVLSAHDGRHNYLSAVVQQRDGELHPSEARRTLEPAPRLRQLEIIDAVNAVAHVSGAYPEEVLIARVNGRTNPLRLAAMVVAVEMGSISGADLARFFGLRSAASFRVAACRARQFISGDVEAAALVASANRCLTPVSGDWTS